MFSWKILLGYNGAINSALIHVGLIEEPLEFMLYNTNAVIITLTHGWAAIAILPIFASLEKSTDRFRKHRPILAKRH